MGATATGCSQFYKLFLCHGCRKIGNIICKYNMYYIHYTMNAWVFGYHKVSKESLVFPIISYLTPWPAGEKACLVKVVSSSFL